MRLWTRNFGKFSPWIHADSPGGFRSQLSESDWAPIHIKPYPISKFALTKSLHFFAKDYLVFRKKQTRHSERYKFRADSYLSEWRGGEARVSREYSRKFRLFQVSFRDEVHRFKRYRFIVEIPPPIFETSDDTKFWGPRISKNH